MKPFKIHCLIAALACLAACDSGKVQDAFADDASRPPSGYTATDDGGAVQRPDADDWRTAPYYAGKVRVEPAYPNPTTGASVTVAVTILEFNAVQGGLYLQARTPAGALRTLDTIQDDAPGTYLLSFSPATVGRSGLFRVFLFDARREIVSYGDVLIN